MTWGLLDTVDHVWLGDDAGPKLFEDELLARAAAQIADVRLGQAPGRTRAHEYIEPAKQLVDEKQNKMSALDALKRIERGLL